MSHASQPIGNNTENFGRCLWQEKRGKVEPEDLSANPVLQISLVE